MRVAIIHHTLASLGGAEKVFAHVVKALNDAGIVPDVYSANPAPPEAIKRHFGLGVRYRAYGPAIRLLQIPAFGIYQKLLMGFAVRVPRDYEAVINTTGVFTLGFDGSRFGTYFLYVYNPLMDVGGRLVLEAGGGGYKYESSPFWRAYFAPFKLMLRRSVARLVRRAREGRVRLWSVSRFTQLRVRRAWGVESEVLYPPCDADPYGLERRERAVATVARFSPEKRWLDMVEIASRMRDVTFYFIGAANTPTYRRHYRRVRAEAEARGLDNVVFMPNAPRDALRDVLGRVKVYVHPMLYEDFGIAVVEALAGGALPIIRVPSGAQEIVPLPDLWFRNVSEAVRMIRSALTSSDAHLLQLIRPMQERARNMFSADRFTAKVKDAVLTNSVAQRNP